MKHSFPANALLVSEHGPACEEKKTFSHFHTATFTKGAPGRMAFCPALMQRKTCKGALSKGGCETGPLANPTIGAMGLAWEEKEFLPSSGK